MKEKEVTELSWDSKKFGFKVARINQPILNKTKLGFIINKLKQKKVHLAYWMVNPEYQISKEAALAHGGFLADQKVTFIRRINKDVGYNHDNSIVSYIHKPVNKKFISLALQSGEYSRFKVDPNFKKNEFYKLYKAWIVNSLNGKIADEVLVFKQGSITAGLITLGNKNNRADIGILAVDEKFRGLSIGYRLIQAAISYFSKNNYTYCQVVTQKRNTMACKFYIKCGFKEERVNNVYHFWL